jgi:hypothetical protein
VKYLFRAKAINVFRSVTKDVAFLKRGDDYYPVYPADLSEKLEKLPEKEREQAEEELLYPDGYCFDFDIDVADRGCRPSRTRGVVEVIFTPLIIDEDLNEAFYPINIGLRLTEGKPKKWSDGSRMRFWKALLKTIRNMTPEEDVDFIREMFPDVCGEEVIIKQSVKFQYADKLRSFMEPLMAIQARSLEETGRFASIIGAEGTPSCFIMPDSWPIEQTPDLTKLLHADKQANAFLSRGEYWAIHFEGKGILLKDSKGLRYIAHLVQHPGQSFLATQLTHAILGSQPEGTVGAKGTLSRQRAADMGLTVSDLGHATERFDAKTEREVKNEIQDLKDRLGMAQETQDQDRAASLREEISVLEHYLASSMGLQGRVRKAGDPVERARKAVANRIDASLKKIKAEHPSLGAHLHNSIKKGTFFSYLPEKPVHWAS